MSRFDGSICWVAREQTPAIGAAQSYPSKPVPIVVASKAGGSLDLGARFAAQKLGTALGRSVFVENRPGAAGKIATEFVAKSWAGGARCLRRRLPPR